MKVAVVSDIHGNWHALRAVLASLDREAPDLIVNGGDLAGGGSRPAQVVDIVRELRWPGVVGNTDEMLWRPERLERQIVASGERDPARREVWRATLEATAADAREQLGEDRVNWLRSTADEFRLDDVAVVHARPGDCWSAPAPAAADDQVERTYGVLGAPVVVYGHIHQPFVRRLPRRLVINAGSVSLSYEGDPRASYALIADGTAVIRRVEYDIEAEITEMIARGMPGADWQGAMLRSGRYSAPPLL